MPPVLREGPYRFFFYSGGWGEPPHVHVERDDQVARFWLDPVILMVSGGLRGHELRHVERIARQNQVLFLEAWNDYFNS